MPTVVNATSPTLMRKGTPVPLKVTSPAQLRSAKLPFSQALAKDIESLSHSVDTLHSVLATNAPTITQILLRDAQTGKVVAAFGDFTFEGVYYTNYLNEIHVGDPLMANDPQNSLFNANKDGSVTVGQNGWLDVLDPFGGNAAWIGTQNDTLPVTGAADNGAGLIRLHVVGHTLATGNSVRVQNVGGVGQPPPSNGTFVNNATGIFTITVIDADHIDLQHSVWAGAYTSGGVVDRVLQIAGAANNGSGLIRLQTAVAHTYTTGDQVNVPMVGGVPNATGQWIVKAIDGTHIDLIGSAFAGAFTAGGTCLRYFAGMLAQTIAIGPSFANYKLREFADGSLRINNATITLSSANGEIVLDPTIPSITLSDQGGNPAVTMEVLQETAIAITATSNASPDVITAPGHTYVNGDTVHVAGSTGDTAINGYRIVEHLSGVGGTFRLTDFAGNPINGNGAYAGGGTITRYYAGLLAQTFAIGSSFTTYKLRAFADGQLLISGASISGGTIDNATLTGSGLSITIGGGGSAQTTLNLSNVDGSFTSTFDPTGAGVNVLTLLIKNGVLAISGTGTQAGLGTMTIDGVMTAKSYVGLIQNLQGVPVIATAPTDGQVLTYVGADSKWEPKTFTFTVPDATATVKGILKLTQDLGGTAALPKVTGLQGVPVIATAPTTGQTLTFDGTKWAPAPASGGGGVIQATGSYTATAADNGKLITFNLSANSTLTLPAVPPSPTWRIAVENVNSSGLVTVTPPGVLTLDGAITPIVLQRNQGFDIYTDGTNYQTQRGGSPGNTSTQPFDVISSFVGKPAAGATVLIATFAHTVTFPANFGGSYGSLGTNPAATATYNVYKNAVLVGQVAIAATGVFTFTTVGGATVVFVAGNRMTVIAPNPQDATASDVGITWTGSR